MPKLSHREMMRNAVSNDFDAKIVDSPIRDLDVVSNDVDAKTVESPIGDPEESSDDDLPGLVSTSSNV